MDEMEDDLVAAYNGLGTADGDEYHRGDDCHACVKDLIRCLRYDDHQRCVVRRRLGKARIMQIDLLPLLTKFSSDVALKSDIIKLLVNLTQPAYLCFGNEYPSTVGRQKDPEQMKSFTEVNSYLKKYKEAFANQKVMNVLGSTLADHCQKDWECRDEDDMIIIERILLLIRNILHVPTEAVEEQRTNDDVSVHDQIIWSLHANGIDELLVFLGSNPEEKQWCLHVMEILFLMLREQAAKPLATAGRGRSITEREKDLRELNDLLAEEKTHKRKALLNRSTRHPRFGGTYVIMNKKGISDEPMIYHRSLQGINNYSRDVEKVKRRKPCNMRPVRDPPVERMSTLSIRLALQQMCVQFLQCCYNPIMKLTKDNLVRERAMEHDDTYYLWVMRFFMEFSRHHHFRVDIIAETLSLPTLHYVLSLMSCHYEDMKMMKRTLPAKHSSQRLHYAIQAYRELLEYVQHMGQSEDATLRNNATVIKNNILYRPEYRDVFVTVLRNYNEVVSSKALLRDLIETVYLYLRLVEQLCKNRGRIVVQGKRKKRGARGGKRKKSRQEDTEHEPVVLSSEQLQEMWDKMRSDIERAINDAEPASCDVLPFDAASDTPIEEQKFTTMAKTRELLRDGKYAECLALVRVAREVWPDDVFGTEGMDMVEQRDVLKKMFLDPVSELMSARMGGMASADEESEDEEQEIVEEAPTETFELEFSLKTYLQKFANAHVVKTYCYLLKEYRTNTEHTNHCIIKMLHRIAFQLKMSPLLYQLSVFRIFQSIFDEPDTSRMKEMQTFSKYIIRSFFEAAKENSVMFVETLFWKSPADCYEITEGYGTLARERDAKVRASMWSREQEEELATLYDQYQDEDDIVGCILAALPSDLRRTRQKVAAQLVRQGCVSSTKELKKKKTSTTHWSTEQDEQLQDHMSLHHPSTPVPLSEVDIDALMRLFPGKSSTNIERHLKKLGYVYTTRKKPQKRGKELPSEISSSDSEIQSEEEEGPSPLPTSTAAAPPPPKKRKRTPKGTTTQTRRKQARPPVGNVVQLVKKLHEQGYGDQVSWLQDYLSDEASDRRDDDEWEEICIVPITEEVSMAIQSVDYQSLLLSIGMQPPSDMEQYWRIPADMTPTQLDEAVQALQQSTDCHDNSVDDQPEDVTLDTAPHTGQHDDTTFNTQEGDGDTHSGGGDIQDCAHDDTTLVDDTPNGLPDDDDGNHSDSSNNGLCIDYQSDAETEETVDQATALTTLMAQRRQQHQQGDTLVDESTPDTMNVTSSTMEDEGPPDASSRTSHQQQQETSPAPYNAAEDARYAATRRRRQLLMDDSDDNDENDPPSD